jgi:hypothetical protein
VVYQMIALQDGCQWALKLTRGDLSILNILARGDNVVGIIDWETAGFLPEYWEHTSACQVNPQDLFWKDEIERFIESEPEALEMGKDWTAILRQYYVLYLKYGNPNYSTFSLLSSMSKAGSSSVLKFPVPLSPCCSFFL